jgi:hypothetical protein
MSTGGILPCGRQWARWVKRDVVAPPLSQVLSEENLTADQLWGWLAEPHPPMPGLDLSRSEIDDIIAYLESIKHH